MHLLVLVLAYKSFTTKKTRQLANNMRVIIFIASSARYLKQYKWQALTFNNEWDIGAILSKKTSEDVVIEEQFSWFRTCPVSTIPGEPNVRFDYHNLKKIVMTTMADYKEVQLICIDEGNIYQAAKLREELSLSKQKSSDVELISNKALSFAALKDSHCRVPKSMSADVSYHTIVANLGTPFILKPTSSSGSFEVSLIYNKTQFEQAKKIEEFTYLASEYIQGRLYHCDLQFSYGQLIFAAAGMYLNPLMEFLKGKNIGSMLLEPQSEEQTSLIQFCIDCLKMMRIEPHGSYHIEVFKQGGEWIFLEGANRPAGGAIVNLYDYAYGINICNQDMLIWMNEKPLKTQEFKPICGISAPKKKGKLTKINFPCLGCNNKVLSFVTHGELMQSPLSITDKALAIFISDGDYDKLKVCFLKLSDFDFIKVEEDEISNDKVE
ncbi:MAG: ATP-grasp domain-containing protein [Shewanella sp.]|nr:ATP-grasp domain-containing protein [Shewanella sp.]MCF1456076.1 ATP-grasp domain-containing protein [Shewanella sp.]